MDYVLPKEFRPPGVHYRQFRPGIDLPRAFYDDIRAIGDRLYIIWHEYRCELDTVMNTYVGPEEDPRFCIHEENGEEVFGWVLKDNKDRPIPERAWHIWERHQFGFSHVCPILFSSPEYLQRLAYRLYMQTKITDKYGYKKYYEFLKAGEEELKGKEKQDALDLQAAVNEENGWLVRRAMENMERGITAPSNPQKDSIMSYGGQKNRSRIIRPLDDAEGGLVVPDRRLN